MVVTSDVSKYFTDTKKGTVKAVDGISIEAHPGQILGLLGANGAGKTTLLRILSTVIQPVSGTATVAGYDVVKEATDVRRNIGFLSASTALYGRLTAKEMLEYFAGLYGLHGNLAKQRVDETIELLRINEFSDRLCDKLSTGQKQRVSIARTILHDPPVLFFDEPTSGLDVLMSQDVMRFVETQRDKGKTIVYCTHILREVERLCDRVYVIHGGKLLGEGSIEGLKQQTGQLTLEKSFLAIVGELESAL